MKRKIAVMLLIILGVPVTSWAEDNPWQFKFGADERFRYEYKQNFDFSKEAKDNGGHFTHRARINAKVLYEDSMEIFAEGLDAQTGSYQTKAVASQTDDFDLHQGYLKLNKIFGSPFDIKLGRQEIKYGKGRLIAAPAWSNRMRTFDAAIVHYAQGSYWGDLLYAQDMKYDDNNFNRSLDEESVSGFYGGYQKDKTWPSLETYFLTQIITSGALPTRRYTVGAMLDGKIKENLTYNVEVPYQFGETNDKDIRAYAVHADVSYQLKDVAFNPKATVEYNQASGDRSSTDQDSNTFIPLYQGTHDPYGIMDMFRLQNIRELSLNLTLNLNEKMKLIPQTNFFWMESTNDSLYNASGTVVRTQTSGDRDAYIGNEASLRFSWTINKYLQWEAGAAHFFTGGYLEDTGADDDANWIYSQFIFKL